MINDPIRCSCRLQVSHLDGGPQDGELRRFPSGLVGLQDLLDESLDLPLRHTVAVARLAEDVDALGQLVVDARLARRRSHGDRSSWRPLLGQMCRSSAGTGFRIMVSAHL